MRLFLLRHGQTEWNTVSRAQGHTDIGLDETGRRQAGLVARRFAGERIERVLTSDLSRAGDTARGIAEAGGAKIEVVPALRERGFGDWEGRHFAELAAAFGASAKSRFALRPPGGESLEDVWERLRPVSQRLLSVDEPTVAVTHGGSLALLLAQMIGAPIEVSRAFRFANTGVTELVRLPDGRWHLAKYNDTHHLESIHDLEDASVGSVDGAAR